MPTRLLTALLALPLWAAAGAGCSSKSSPQGHSALLGEVSASEAAEQLERMRTDAAALAQRPELDAERMTVRHVLIAFQGSSVPGVRRSKGEAEALAARIYAAARGGVSTDELKQQFSDDTGGGTYGMVLSGTGRPDDFPRNGMVPAFGDVGWRLEVGEVGVAPFDPVASPFGWHVIERID